MAQYQQNTTIDVTDARSGMVLQKDVTNRQGQVLLPAGTALSDRHIQLLSANGIERLLIRTGEAAPEQPEKPPISPEELDSTIKKRFLDNDGENPVIKELARICRARMEAQ